MLVSNGRYFSQTINTFNELIEHLTKQNKIDAQISDQKKKTTTVTSSLVMIM